MPRARPFEIRPKGLFSLDQSHHFLTGFEPLKGAAAESGPLVFAFALDEEFIPVAVAMEQSADGVVRGKCWGTDDVERAKRQAARILSLDVDGQAYAALGKRDPVIGGLQEQRPGFRPVCFFSPYEAAAQAVIAQRISIRQAGKIRQQMVLELGGAVELDGQTLHAFPSPERLLQIKTFPHLPQVKVERLQAVARAALEGRLDAERLRALPPEEALEELQTIPGIGSWSAQHVLMRGTGIADLMPTAESRVFAAAAIAYGKKRPLTVAEFTELSDRWRPYRMWASVLVVGAYGFSAKARAMLPISRPRAATPVSNAAIKAPRSSA